MLAAPLSPPLPGDGRELSVEGHRDEFKSCVKVTESVWMYKESVLPYFMTKREMWVDVCGWKGGEDVCGWKGGEEGCVWMEGKIEPSGYQKRCQEGSNLCVLCTKDRFRMVWV